MSSLLETISEAVASGEPAEKVKELTKKAVDEGFEVRDILDNGLVAGMNTIGKRWADGDAFIPEVILSSQVMNAGVEVIQDIIVKSGIKPIGKAVIGTVQGDVHDIGKSLVSMMLRAFGFEVHDLGVDVPSKEFIDGVKAREADLLCMSALLTTTMPQMKNTIEAAKKEGLRVKTIIGGAPTSQEYATSIGADGYAPDAILAVDKAKELLGEK
jgi:5-methyltetrahydrofolate--homocysteine methyltransferase